MAHRDCGGRCSHLGEIHPGRIGPQQLALNVLLHTLQDTLLMQKVNFMLGGVHIDIYILGTDFQTGMKREERNQMMGKIYRVTRQCGEAQSHDLKTEDKVRETEGHLWYRGAVQFPGWTQRLSSLHRLTVGIKSI